MSKKLNLQTLHKIESVQKPNYDRRNITSGIVHIGVGGFHRAHQAVYTDDLLASGAQQWGITGVSLRSDSVHKALAPQNFLYTVKTQDQNGDSKRLIGSICEVLALPQPGALEKIVAKIADPSTQVVTLTITENGYCHTADGELDHTNPGIVRDLQYPGQPQTTPGLLALALTHRMKLNAGPITLLSCDNLSSNGDVLRNVVTSMLQQHPATRVWLADNVSFPSSMVDRIVPKTKASDIDQLEQESDYRDSGLVVCEAFSQWVIEDNFCGARPSWNVAGAQFVSNVEPYEQAKLRLLNATHSALAYLGLLAGYTYIHQAMADPRLAKFVRHLMDAEIEPVVTCPENLQLPEYTSSILSRFANAAVPYRTAQVASDGSQKLPQRIFPTIQAQQSLGVTTPGLHLVVAGWLHCLTRTPEQNRNLNISDPLAPPLISLTAAHPQPQALVSAIARGTPYFGQLAKSDVFVQSVAKALQGLRQKGSLAMIAELLRP